MTRVTNYLQHRFLTTDLLNRCAVREAKCDKSGGHPLAESEQAHLSEALDWLLRAQDAMPYGGLSRGYSFGWNPYFPKRGWQPPHPRPTAEAIHTLSDCVVAMSRADLRQRAIGLADWLVKIQMYSGAIRGGALDEPPSSEILNTALAVLGWMRVWRETKSERFAQATRRACDFLLGQGRKETGAKTPTISNEDHHQVTFASTVGLALIQAGIVLEEYRYCAAGEKCIAHILGRQQGNGWFQCFGLDQPRRLLLQTIATIVDSLMRSGLILDNDKYLRSAKRAADALLEKLPPGRLLSGRFHNDWSEAASWSCLTGNGQMACIWMQLHQRTGEERYLRAAEQTTDLLRRDQNRTSSHPGLRGGIKGSFPCDVDFGRYQTLSSATGQFINALLLLSRPSPQPSVARRLAAAAAI